MTTTELETARALIARAQRVLVVTHVNPDGDAVGSLLGFGLATARPCARAAPATRGWARSDCRSWRREMRDMGHVAFGVPRTAGA